jgi:nucleotide-binding universal stress UspA family protein
MTQIKTILAATDFSPGGERALQRAAQLAAQHGAELTLLHVIPTLPLEAFKRLLLETPIETEQRLVNVARTQLRERADDLRARYGVAVGVHVGIGRVHAEINGHAQACGADLIVIGAHGEHFLRDVFLGTTVSKVLRAGRHPLLIVRSAKTDPYRRILAAVDFSPSSRLALRVALKMADPASIYVLHAFEAPFEGKMLYAGVSEQMVQQYHAQALNDARQKMEAFLTDLGGGEVARITEQGYAPAVIREQSQALGADLIVIGKRGGTDLDEALLGSVTKHVLYETACDLLVVSLPAGA